MTGWGRRQVHLPALWILTRQGQGARNQGTGPCFWIGFGFGARLTRLDENEDHICIVKDHAWIVIAHVWTVEANMFGLLKLISGLFISGSFLFLARPRLSAIQLHIYTRTLQAHDRKEQGHDAPEHGQIHQNITGACTNSVCAYS